MFRPEQAVYESSSCSMSSPIFGISHLLNFRCSDGCRVTAHCGFVLLLILPEDTCTHQRKPERECCGARYYED